MAWQTHATSGNRVANDKKKRAFGRKRVRAFIIALVLLVAISGVAAYFFETIPVSSQEAFTVQDNVRLSAPGQAD